MPKRHSFLSVGIWDKHKNHHDQCNSIVVTNNYLGAKLSIIHCAEEGKKYCYSEAHITNDFQEENSKNVCIHSKILVCIPGE